MVRGKISTLDAQKWACMLKQANILQFEYKDLPKEFKDKAILFKAKQEKFIMSLGKNGNGVHLWRIANNLKCREENKNTDKNINDN